MELEKLYHQVQIFTAIGLNTYSSSSKWYFKCVAHKKIWQSFGFLCLIWKLHNCVWKFWLVTWWISWKIWQDQGHFWVIIEGAFILTWYISLHCSNSARLPGGLWQDSVLSPTQALSGFFFRFKYHTLTHWTTLLRVLFSLMYCVVLCFV